MIITREPIATRLPIEPAAMAGRSVVQWDKNSLEEAGLVKLDLLGLRMLSALDEAVRRARDASGVVVDLDRLSFDDTAVYALIASADTIGVFQVESRAQAQVLPRLRPACFADLLVAISLIRPGPVQGNMVHPYLRRRQGLEPVTYSHPRLRPALEETLGVILFQEQVLLVARDVAGWTPGQGERLRRALGKRDEAALAPMHARFVADAQVRDVDTGVAEQVWGQLASFAGYSFPKSHAAAFAVVVYQSAWLKRYHPAPFYAALLNNQPMGFWSPAVLVGDARRHGVPVLPLDIAVSDWCCTVEGDDIRLGFNYVAQLGEQLATRLLNARVERSFASLRDCCRRTQLPRALVEQLIRAGACDAWGERRSLLWELAALHYDERELDLVSDELLVALPPLTEAEAQALERGVLGVSTGDHPMVRWRPWLQQAGIVSSADVSSLPHGQHVRAAGLLVVHQAPPTAKGHHFLTLDDEFGMINVVVRPAIVARDSAWFRTVGMLVVEGVVQRDGDVVNLVALQVAPFGHGG